MNKRTKIIIDLDTEAYQPGAVWMAHKPGWSGNRIIQAIMRNEENKPRGISYLTTTTFGEKKIKFCSVKNWKDWIKNQEATFSHISLEHIMVSDHNGSSNNEVNEIFDAP